MKPQNNRLSDQEFDRHLDEWLRGEAAPAPTKAEVDRLTQAVLATGGSPRGSFFPFVVPALGLAAAVLLLLAAFFLFTGDPATGPEVAETVEEIPLPRVDWSDVFYLEDQLAMVEWHPNPEDQIIAELLF